MIPGASGHPAAGFVGKIERPARPTTGNSTGAKLRPVGTDVNSSNLTFPIVIDPPPANAWLVHEVTMAHGVPRLFRSTAALASRLSPESRGVATRQRSPAKVACSRSMIALHSLVS